MFFRVTANAKLFSATAQCNNNKRSLLLWECQFQTYQECHLVVRFSHLEMQFLHDMLNVGLSAASKYEQNKAPPRLLIKILYGRQSFSGKIFRVCQQSENFSLPWETLQNTTASTPIRVQLAYILKPSSLPVFRLHSCGTHEASWESLVLCNYAQDRNYPYVWQRRSQANKHTQRRDK